MPLVPSRRPSYSAATYRDHAALAAGGGAPMGQRSKGSVPGEADYVVVGAGSAGACWPRGWPRAGRGWC